MAEHPIQGLMNVTMDKIRQMADSNTIIGKPIKTDDGITILPVSPHLLRLCFRRHRLRRQECRQQGPVRRRLRRGRQHPAGGLSGGEGRLRAHHPAVRRLQHR